MKQIREVSNEEEAQERIARRTKTCCTDDDKNSQEDWKNPKCPLDIKVPVVVALSPIHQQQCRDQESGKNEEHIHSQISERENPNENLVSQGPGTRREANRKTVMSENQEVSDTPYSVQSTDVTKPIAPARCTS
jgi:hypothetical protein